VFGLQRFIIASALLHLALFSALFLSLAPRKPQLEEKSITTRLITPREFLEPEKKIIIPKIPVRERPIKKDLPLKMKSAPFSDGNEEPSYKMEKTKPIEAPLPPAGEETARAAPPGAEDLPYREEKKGPVPGLPSKPIPAPPLKEKLFDKRVIEDLAAKKEPGSPHLPSPKDVITFSTKEMRYISYMQRLKERIEGIWKYPRAAAEQGIFGDLYIRFAINKDGTLGDMELVRTSGHQMLDDAAMKALREAEPFWPLPDNWEEDTFTVEGHFIYSLYGVVVK